MQSKISITLPEKDNLNPGNSGQMLENPTCPHA